MKSAVFVLALLAIGTEANLHCYADDARYQNAWDHASNGRDVTCYASTKYCFVRKTMQANGMTEKKADCDYNYGNICSRGDGCFRDNTGLAQICCCSTDNCNVNDYSENDQYYYRSAGTASLVTVFIASFVYFIYSLF